MLRSGREPVSQPAELSAVQLAGRQHDRGLRRAHRAASGSRSRASGLSSGRSTWRPSERNARGGAATSCWPICARRPTRRTADRSTRRVWDKTVPITIEKNEAATKAGRESLQRRLPALANSSQQGRPSVASQPIERHRSGRSRPGGKLRDGVPDSGPVQPAALDRRDRQRRRIVGVRRRIVRFVTETAGKPGRKIGGPQLRAGKAAERPPARRLHQPVPGTLAGPWRGCRKRLP